MSEVARLTKEVHKHGLETGGLCPHEMPQFDHLPMKWEGDTPVFDASRMTAEQIWDTVCALEDMLPEMGTSGGTVRGKVEDHMTAYGRFGLRVKDICSAVHASKPIVLKYLRELVDAGKVEVREEATRGSGSTRKRYFLVGQSPQYGTEEFLPESGALLVVKGDRGVRDRDRGSGICHHGASVHALMCPNRCSRCQWAIEEALTGEAVSAARRAGGSGFAEGLELRTARRLAAEAVWAKAARKVGV